MKAKKKLFITVLVSLICVLVVWFVILDFSRFASLDYTYDIFPSGLLKRICVVLASLIAWVVGRDGLDFGDSLLMKSAFAFACLGEAALALGEQVGGIWMFAICQSLLIMRNSKGLFDKLAHASYIQKFRLFLASAFVYLVFLVFLILSRSFIGLTITSLTAYFYGVILSTSLLAALACKILKLLPHKNAEMAATGVICFFCCDILVGLDAALWEGIPWLLANSLIWIFYIPALAFLA
ncbi:MAG: hypothetical protein ACM3ZR_02830, partial [Pseudomonadota bacterium]